MTNITNTSPNNDNDQRILELKEQIETKKKELGKIDRFVPITNCIIEVDGVTYNLHTLQKKDLVLLMVKLNAYRLSAADLGTGVLEQCVISGYNIADWIFDIREKLRVQWLKDDERKLKIMEEKLTKLLSEKKKVELEIDEIEFLLQGAD